MWSKEEYANGKLHGVRTVFYDHGRVRTRSTYRNGKEIKTEKFPKFHNPRPAVLLSVEANAKLYEAWGHPPLDVYLTPCNLEQVQAQLKVPTFIEEVFERNKSGNLKEEYEDLNTFDDSITYMVMVNERGIVGNKDRPDPAALVAVGRTTSCSGAV